MNMVDYALKVSATVCLTTSAIAMAVLAAEVAIHGSGMARSFNNAMNGINRAAYAMENAFVTVDDVLSDLSDYSVEVAQSTRDTFGSIARAFEKLAVMVEKIDPKDYKKNTNKLLRGIANFLNATANKANQLNMQSVNDAVSSFKGVIDRIIEEASRPGPDGETPQGFTNSLLKSGIRMIGSQMQKIE